MQNLNLGFQRERERCVCVPVLSTFYRKSFAWPPSTIVPNTHDNRSTDVTLDDGEVVDAHASTCPLTRIMHRLADVTVDVADKNQNGYVSVFYCSGMSHPC